MTHVGSPSVGVAIITHNAKHHLPHCLPPYLNSSLNPNVLVVNSSSQDGTVELAQEMGANTLVVPRSSFNHGSTREKARKHLGTDIVVMTTPDAYAESVHFLENLIEPIAKEKASIAYARQISHNTNDFFETFPRDFNYPERGHTRGIEDVDSYGVYTFFCSNSCAAYRNDALEEIGGFQPVLLGEDTVAVSKLLRLGHRIAYNSAAVIKHSHRYTLKQEFQRSFDTGLARRDYADLLSCGHSDSKRGLAYTKSMFKRLKGEKPLLIPYALAQTLTKWLGYQIGKRSCKSPLWFKRTCSSQDFYWT